MATLIIEDLSLTEELMAKRMQEIVGGFFMWGIKQYLEADEGVTVSCNNGYCGEYPVGARTDEAR